MESGLLKLTGAGIYCPVGGFYIDPWQPVENAVITHAHSDHARPRMQRYTCSASSAVLLRLRVGSQAHIRPVPFGESLQFGRVLVSLHPAGHILGSAQVRVELDGEVWVVTGDHNATHVHAAAEPFEAVRCDTLITESTFGLPVYQWPSVEVISDEIHAWWRRNQEQGRTSILPCYPLGKTQRILQMLDGEVGPIAVADPGRSFVPEYEAAGVRFPPHLPLRADHVDQLRGRGLVLISFSGEEPSLLRRLQPLSYAAASGWMQIRGARNQGSLDLAFVLSDHSDWGGLLKCVRESGAKRIGVTHGQVEAFSRYLREIEGLESFIVPTHFEQQSKH